MPEQDNRLIHFFNTQTSEELAALDIRDEVAYNAGDEYCETLANFIARRSRLSFLDTDATGRALLFIIEILTIEHGWDKA